MLLKLSHETNILKKAQRQLLVDSIVNFYINKNISLSIKKCGLLTNEIISLFPEETAVFYFLKQYKKSPKGKLYSKYHNNLKKLKKCGLIKSNKVESSVSNIQSSSLLDIEREHGETTRCKLRFMKEADDWETVKNLWNATTKYRKEHLTNYNTIEVFNKWPAYSWTSGYELVKLIYFFK